MEVLQRALTTTTRKKTYHKKGIRRAVSEAGAIPAAGTNQNHTDMKAVYRYKTTDFQGGYIVHETPVEIIGETDKSYKVRFLSYSARGHRPNDVTFVGKKAVRLPYTTNITNYRSPYAD